MSQGRQVPWWSGAPRWWSPSPLASPMVASSTTYQVEGVVWLCQKRKKRGCHCHATLGTLLSTPCPNKSMLLDLNPWYERYGTAIFRFDGTCIGTGILLPVPWSPDCDVCVVLVSWLRLDFVPLRVVLGASGSLRLLSIDTIHSVCSRCFRFLARAFHPFISLCLLSTPLSMLTALKPC
jgi:hypothetical protein